MLNDTGKTTMEKAVQKKEKTQSEDPPQRNTSTSQSNNTKNGNGNNGNGNGNQGKNILSWVKNILPSNKTLGDDSLRAQIEELIDGRDEQSPESSVAAHERHLISNILDLRDLPVIDVMVPRADIVAIDIKTTKDDLFTILSEKPHSRLPVFEESLDNIIGVIHMKDLVTNMGNNTNFKIKDVMRKALVVSPAMRVMDMLLQMRQSKVHIAFVVDEFGGIDGLITINDLIGAIVGEIDDEFDFDISPQMIERSDGSVLAHARYPLEDFENRVGQLFFEEGDTDREEIDTVGGLVIYLAGHVPARGEIITHEPTGVDFQIIDADPRRILRLRVHNLPQRNNHGTS